MCVCEGMDENLKHLLVKFEKFNLVSLLLSLMLLNVRTSTLIYILKFILCSPDDGVVGKERGERRTIIMGCFRRQSGMMWNIAAYIFIDSYKQIG